MTDNRLLLFHTYTSLRLSPEIVQGDATECILLSFIERVIPIGSSQLSSELSIRNCNTISCIPSCFEYSPK